jgi:hypothetical protein
MLILVTGGRKRLDRDTIWNDLDKRVPAAGDTLTIRHGACPSGADHHAHTWCEEFAGHHDNQGITIAEDPRPADWKQHGKRAGMIRNGEMVRLGADQVLAYPDPDSVGTYGCVDLAVRARIPVVVNRLPGDPPKRIQRSRAGGWKKPPAAVIVTRPSVYGNPFRIGQRVPETYGTGSVRDGRHAVELFRQYVRRAGEPYLRDVRRALAGRDVCCWCAPGDVCHSDVLLTLAAGGTP